MLRVLLPSILGGAAFAIAYYAWTSERADRFAVRRAERMTWGDVVPLQREGDEQ